jgi:hypothetical protein
LKKDAVNGFFQASCESPSNGSVALYRCHEMQRASLEPMRLFASGALTMLNPPGSPLGSAV